MYLPGVYRNGFYTGNISEYLLRMSNFTREINSKKWK